MSLETTVSGTRPNVFLSDVRVYIAGVLMPVTHVTVRSGAGQMPEASISLPPCPDLFVVGRMDRIPVHIFVRESVVGTGHDSSCCSKEPLSQNNIFVLRPREKSTCPQYPGQQFWTMSGWNS